MFNQMLKTTILLSTPILVAACQSSSSVSPTPTPVAMLATQGSIAQSISDVTSSQILAAANGPVDWSGQNGPFPTTISGGDGFQADPTNDASFGTLINAVRTASGAAPLTYNAQLDSAAQAHSQDMVDNGYFSHIGQNGSTPTSRARAAGYATGLVGENIAQGQANENLAINGWISSPGHQDNNVNPNYQSFGLGRAGTGSSTTWTLMFGTE
ncbi:CAP domain-containing protein [Planktotalea sp.]|uniref:CAP domain-containing protein n=1 Tax=Planktotalea sp. TaxID=2029877 RepID=UPI00329A574F